LTYGRADTGLEAKTWAALRGEERPPRLAAPVGLARALALSDLLIAGAEPGVRDRFERSLGQVFSQSKPERATASAFIQAPKTILQFDRQGPD